MTFTAVSLLSQIPSLPSFLAYTAFPATFSVDAGIKESSGEALRLFEDADANASARIILLAMETVADILIIEDDPSINEVVCAHLERRGYRCRQAFSGTEGLLLLREQRPDVVITDLMLPGVPGEEIVRAIRGADSALPIIVISARITAADKISLLQAGADDYLTKPFDLDELQARIEVQRRHHAERAHAGTAASTATAPRSCSPSAAGSWIPTDASSASTARRWPSRARSSTS